VNDPLQKILAERKRQDDTWGEQNHNDYCWLAILMEEVGETSSEMLEMNSEKMEEELVQVAAVSLAWLECLERKRCADSRG